MKPTIEIIRYRTWVRVTKVVKFHNDLHTKLMGKFHTNVTSNISNYYWSSAVCINQCFKSWEIVVKLQTLVSLTDVGKYVSWDTKRLIIWRKDGNIFNYGQRKFLSDILKWDPLNFGLELMLDCLSHGLRTPNKWRHKSEISEKLGRCGRQNMLRPYLKRGLGLIGKMIPDS